MAVGFGFRWVGGSLVRPWSSLCMITVPLSYIGKGQWELVDGLDISSESASLRARQDQ